MFRGAVLVATAVSFILVFMSCAGNNTSEFGDRFEAPPTSECHRSAIKNQLLVKWKAGGVSMVDLREDRAAMRNFVTINGDMIETVEYNYLLRIDSPSVGTEAGNPAWGQEMIEAPAVWSEGLLGEGVVVAVVDSGVDFTHAQLQDRILENVDEVPGNGADDDGNGFVDDSRGWNFHDNNEDVEDVFNHGTHVAGIIAAVHENGEVKGIAPQAKILPLRFTDSQGNGNVALAVSAIDYAVKSGVNVINASWGGADCSVILKERIDTLAADGVLFVASAGNEGANIDQSPSYPASFNSANQVTVGASTEGDTLAAFSNFSVRSVHLSAPGEGIDSTVPGGTLTLSGSSMAAAFVSGAAAVLKGAFPSATVAEIKHALVESVDISGHEVVSGGRLNLRRAVESLRGSQNTADPESENDNE